jgi:hypothetical protein
MFASRSPFARWLAAGLPVCFLWVFISCVSLCSEHAAKASVTRTSFVAASLCAVEPSDDWHCPFTEVSSQRVLPERQSLASSQSISPLLTVYAPSEQPMNNITSLRVDFPSFLSYADPPFESLRTLRI